MPSQKESSLDSAILGSCHEPKRSLCEFRYPTGCRPSSGGGGGAWFGGLVISGSVGGSGVGLMVSGMVGDSTGSGGWMKRV